MSEKSSSKYSDQVKALRPDCWLPRIHRCREGQTRGLTAKSVQNVSQSDNQDPVPRSVVPITNTTFATLKETRYTNYYTKYVYQATAPRRKTLQKGSKGYKGDTPFGIRELPRPPLQMGRGYDKSHSLNKYLLNSGTQIPTGISTVPFPLPG